MSTADERLLRALNAIQCQCMPLEQTQGHKADCWMPGLSAVHATFSDGDIGPWISVADPAQPPPRGRELIVACADWPHFTELGRPVPVRVGLLGPTGRWTVWGAEWTPTHYKVAPTGPRQSRGIG
jgi:hypothetical protein